MKATIFKHVFKNKYSRSFDIYLVILSSILLGIWAVKETIALRNILLFSGAILSIYCIIQEFKYGNLKEQCDFWRVLPILLLGLTFVWVVCHFLFLSIDSSRQLEELSSTWLRALMASIVGLATGLAVRNHPNRLTPLWFGIFIAFIALFCQYIPRALAQQKLLVPDYDYYLFHLKINTVLMGTILLAGINGALFDYLRSIGFRWRCFRVSYIAYWLIGTAMILWSFVFVVDARNGIGLSTILYCFWFLCAAIILTQNSNKLSRIENWLIFLFATIGLLIILCFTLLQTNVNPGWNNFINDAKIAVRINQYNNWQNPVELGYPKRDDGQTVARNTYERVAWATAGSRAIFKYPLGVGVLAYPFSMQPHRSQNMETLQDLRKIATHSGWVDLGLAFGFPMLMLIFGILAMSFVNAVRGNHPAKITILGFIILFLCLYTVGEVAIDHGIEILFFFLALLPALMLIKPDDKS